MEETCIKRTFQIVLYPPVKSCRGTTWLIHGIVKEEWRVSATETETDDFLYKRCFICVEVKYWISEWNKYKEITITSNLLHMSNSHKVFLFLNYFSLSSVSNTHLRLRNKSESLCHRWDFNTLMLGENFLLAFNGSLNSFKEIWGQSLLKDVLFSLPLASLALSCNSF